MKKQFLFLALGIVFLSSCNFKKDKKEDNADSLSTVESHESLEENANNSNQKLSFTFNGENFENDLTRPFELEATYVKGDTWIISFTGLETDVDPESGDYKEVTMSFNLVDYKFTTDRFDILNCTINLMGFEDIDASDEILTSNDHQFLLEITGVEKVKTETVYGITTDFYSINGIFSGEFRNMTGTKTFKVENGSFENYMLPYTP
ncbi:hypothetical protein [Cellulophaga baltica]|uniref:Uncharacterized protein n=1 Tax=Cellulophaga baltica TaxID=76594 RepID=A0A1G7LSZ5_9FLAO|nr:hypothetical protein [Cellulophaga baltica]SDF52563.1 hypothetical protein SAMN04487992_12117 [Cellulophaga baltica]